MGNNGTKEKPMAETSAVTVEELEVSLFQEFDSNYNFARIKMKASYFGKSPTCCVACFSC